MLNLFTIFAPRMKLTTSISTEIVRKKLVTALFVVASLAAFATLGDGGGEKKLQQSKSLLSARTGLYNFKDFTLKSTYNWRGNTVFNKTHEVKYITLNNVISYQKGNSTYILPMKRKVLLDKIKLNPAPPRY
jgi:hypothetical protein